MPSNTSGMASRPAALLLLLLALPSCSTGDADEPQAGGARVRVQRGSLEVREIGSEERWGATSDRSQQVAHFEIGSELPTWRVVEHERGEKPAAIELKNRIKGERKLMAMVLPLGRNDIILPSPPHPATYNRIVVRALLHKGDVLHVSLGTHSRDRLVSEKAEYGDPPGEQEYSFDVADFASASEPNGELRIMFSARRQRPRFVSASFLMTTRSQHLPRVGGEAAMVEIRREARWAVGLSSERELICRFPADNHASMLWAIGQTASVCRPGEKCVVKLRLWHADERESQAQSYDYELRTEEQLCPWQSIQVPLAKMTGKAFNVAFSLSSSLESDAFCFLTQPQVVIGARSASAPTVLLITSDTHRGDHLGIAQMGVDVNTPFLDGLARTGLYFSDCTSSTNITVPSHVALLTGVSPRDHGVLTNAQRLSSTAPTLAERFKDAGFITLASVSMASLTEERGGVGQGFDQLAAPAKGQHDSQFSIESLRAWMDDAEGLPLFAWLHIFDAHTPYEPPPEFSALYYPAHKDPYDKSVGPLPGKLAQHLTWAKGVRDIDWLQALYKAEVSYLDKQLRGLIEGSRFEHGILAITADHGENLGGSGRYFGHGRLSPATLHVPLIMKWPGGPTQLVKNPVRQIDIGRTLLNLADCADQEFPGIDLSDTRQQIANKPRFAIEAQGTHACVIHTGHMLVIRLAPVKIKSPSGIQFPSHGCVLYDLVADPRCEKTIQSSAPELTAKMRKLLINWLTSGAQVSWRDEHAVATDETLAELAAMGYSSAEVELEEGWIDPHCDCVNCAPFK